MKRILILIASLFLIGVTPVAAAPSNIDCYSLDMSQYHTQKEFAAVRAVCQKATATPVDKITPDDVREWSSLGKEFAAGVTETARGLGVTVNEFLMTPAGVLIAFYFMWDVIGGILIGIPLLIGVWVLFWVLYNRIITVDRDYEFVPVLWGAFNRKRIKSVTYASVDTQGGAIFCLGVPAIILSGIVLGAIIF